MQTLLPLLFLVSFILLIIGLFKPQTSLWWYKGEKTRKQSGIIYGIACLGLAFASGAFFAPPKTTTTTPSVSEKPSVKILPDSIMPYATKEQIEHQFDPWNGSHIHLVKAVKKAMHDPSSFEHDQTSYIQNETTLIVTMSYRGNNAVGAKVLSQVIAEVDAKTGDILSIKQ